MCRLRPRRNAGWGDSHGGAAVPTERWPVLTAGSRDADIRRDCEQSLLPTLNAWQADAVYNVRASKRSVQNCT